MITAQCPCGREYQLDESTVGKRAKCQLCGQQFVVEPIAEVDVVPAVDERVLEAEVVQEAELVEVVPVHETRHASFAATDEDEQMDRDLEWVRDRTQSSASNPGRLRVSFVRYAMAFPKWFMIWHGLMVGTLALILLHWAFVFLALPFVGIVFLYWRRLKYHFVGGAVNPGKVLSLDPPLLAVHTDLSKGYGDWEVIKIHSHPLSRMSSGRPTPGQNVATVAVYQDIYGGELDHWDNFFPVVADVVTSNQNDIRRLFDSITAEDAHAWRSLDDALRQVPQPYQEGIYRVYDPAETESLEFNPEMLDSLTDVLGELSDKHVFLAAEGIDPNLLATASQSYAPNVNPATAVALFESAQVSKAAETGMIWTRQGVFFSYPEVGTGMFGWNDLIGALTTEGTLELTLRNGTRLRIPDSHFRRIVTPKIEVAINQLLGYEDAY